MNWVRGLRRVVLVVGVATSLFIACWTLWQASFEHIEWASERDDFLASYEPTCVELLDGYTPRPESVSESDEEYSSEEVLAAQRARLEWLRREAGRLELMGEKDDELIGVLEERIQFPEDNRSQAAIGFCRKNDNEDVRSALSQARLDVAYWTFELAAIWTVIPALLFGFAWLLISPVASLLGWLRKGFADE